MILEAEKLLRMVEQSRLSPVMLTRVLLYYSKMDQTMVQRLIAATKPSELDWVFDILSMYPTTEIGWSILPVSRTPFLKPDLDRTEAGDVEHRQYQEDRMYVEYLRHVIRG